MAFSRDKTTPRPRFKPGPGQIGQHAGLQALKPPSAASQRRSSGGGEGGRGKALGLPGLPAPAPAAGPDQGAAPETADHRHLLAAAQYENMKDLGRTAPFGVWFNNNGLFRQLFTKGEQPFDWFQHT